MFRDNSRVVDHGASRQVNVRAWAPGAIYAPEEIAYLSGALRTGDASVLLWDLISELRLYIRTISVLTETLTQEVRK